MTERRETGRKTLSVDAGEKDWSKGERIAKWLAAAGVCSRRDAERLIEDGKVAVDGEVLDSPAFKVSGRERITVDGKRVGGPDRTRLWRYHKPKGLVTTNSDPDGRETVFDYLPKNLPRVMTIGRLDLTTEGLLLLTNDGELARALELPTTGLRRCYRARAYGEVTQKDLDQLLDGVVYEGIEYRSIVATLDRRTGDNNWIDMVLTEGKKREARRALESVGLRVNRLIRVSYGPFELADLPEGAVAEVPAADLLAEFGDKISRKRRPDPSRAPQNYEPPQKKGRGGKSGARSGPSAAPYGDRPRSAAGKSHSPHSGPKQPSRSGGGRPGPGKPNAGKPGGHRPTGAKPDAQKRGGPARPGGGRPNGGRPTGGRSGGNRPTGGKR